MLCAEEGSFVGCVKRDGFELIAIPESVLMISFGLMFILSLLVVLVPELHFSCELSIYKSGLTVLNIDQIGASD